MKATPIVLALLAALSLAVGCTRDIGDECSTSVDCDPNGTRACDLSQPGGYCTIQGCTEQSCPGGSACIRLFPVKFLDQTHTCVPACEDLMCSDPAAPTSGLPDCPAACLDTSIVANPLDACAPDELCLDVGLCARRSLEQRYCAKACGDNGDCRSGYDCRQTGGSDGSMALSATPGITTKYCAPAVSQP